MSLLPPKPAGALGIELPRATGMDLPGAFGMDDGGLVRAPEGPGMERPAHGGRGGKSAAFKESARVTATPAALVLYYPNGFNHCIGPRHYIWIVVLLLVKFRRRTQVH